MLPTLETTLDALAIARAAAEEGIDARTLRRRLRGEPVRGLAGARADRAIARLRGMTPSGAASDAAPTVPNSGG